MAWYSHLHKTLCGCPKMLRNEGNCKVHIVLLPKLKHWDSVHVSSLSSLHRDKESVQKQNSISRVLYLLLKVLRVGRSIHSHRNQEKPEELSVPNYQITQGTEFTKPHTPFRYYYSFADFLNLLYSILFI